MLKFELFLKQLFASPRVIFVISLVLIFIGFAVSKGVKEAAYISTLIVGTSAFFYFFFNFVEGNFD